MLDLKQALSVAISAAHAAGEILKKRFKTAMKVATKSSERDLVTDVDHEAQAVIVQTIQKHYPDHRFLTEEVGTEKLGDPTSPYLWVIDPLDGTKNFVHGKKECGTMIALQEKDETILAVTLNPFIHAPERSSVRDSADAPAGAAAGGPRGSTGTLATAIRGRGTRLNGEPVTLRKTRDMLDAILATNTMHGARTEDSVCRPVFPLCGDIHNYGAAIEEFTAILRGENDGIFFFSTNPWDVVPGFLMIEEAGGAARLERNEPGKPRGGVRGVACTKPIFDELCDFLWK